MPLFPQRRQACHATRHPFAKKVSHPTLKTRKSSQGLSNGGETGEEQWIPKNLADLFHDIFGIRKEEKVRIYISQQSTS